MLLQMFLDFSSRISVQELLLYIFSLTRQATLLSKMVVSFLFLLRWVTVELPSADLLVFEVRVFSVGQSHGCFLVMCISSVVL